MTKLHSDHPFGTIELVTDIVSQATGVSPEILMNTEQKKEYNFARKLHHYFIIKTTGIKKYTLAKKLGKSRKTIQNSWKHIVLMMKDFDETGKRTHAVVKIQEIDHHLFYEHPRKMIENS